MPTKSATKPTPVYFGPASDGTFRSGTERFGSLAEARAAASLAAKGGPVERRYFRVGAAPPEVPKAAQKGKGAAAPAKPALPPTPAELLATATTPAQKDAALAAVLDGTVEEVSGRLDVDDGTLNALEKAEAAGKGRKGVLDAIHVRRREIGEQAAEGQAGKPSGR